MIFANKKNKAMVLASICICGIAMAVFVVFGQNHDFYIVVNESMSPSLQTGDLVFISNDNNKTCPSLTCLNVGDIIVFEPKSAAKNSESSRTIVHRIEEILHDSNSDIMIRTKGDANPNSIPGVDYPITEGNFIGKVLHVLPYLGLLLMYLGLLAQIFMQPIFYILIAVVIGAVLLMEYQKRKGV